MQADPHALFRAAPLARRGGVRGRRLPAEGIIGHYGDAFDGIPVTCAHQRKQDRLAHALLTVEERIDDDFTLMLGDDIFRANLADVVKRQRDDWADAAFLVEEGLRYGVCRTNDLGEIVEVIEKPNSEPSIPAMTGSYTFTPAIFHAYYLV